MKVMERETKAKAMFAIGEVNSQMCLDLIKELLDTNWIEYSELTLYICSEGGSLPDCFAILDMINFIRETFGIHVTTFGLGEAASAGFFLLCSGDDRAIFPNCQIYVHEHLTIGDGTSSYSERKREDKDQDRLYTMYINYTAERLGISKARVQGLLKKNRYLKPSELISYNIITKNDSDG